MEIMEINFKVRFNGKKTFKVSHECMNDVIKVLKKERLKKKKRGDTSAFF